MKMSVDNLNKCCEVVKQQNKQIEKNKFNLSKNYCHIEGWMVQDLGLKGNELIIYAIIYGFSQDGENWFEGSLSYLASWTNSTKQGIMKNLNNLTEKGFIIKEEVFKNNIKFCKYKCIEFNTIKQSLTGSKQSLTNILEDSSLVDNNNYSIYSNNVSLTKFNTSNQQNGLDLGVPKIEKQTNKFIDLIATMFSDDLIREELRDYYLMLQKEKQGALNMTRWRGILKGLKHSIADNKFVNNQHIIDHIQFCMDEGLQSLRRKTEINDFQRKKYSGQLQQSEPENFDDFYAEYRNS